MPKPLSDPLDNPLAKLLVCPRDHRGLTRDGDQLVCEDGHRYPIVKGVPILMIEEQDVTQPIARQAKDQEVLDRLRAEPYWDGAEGEIHPLVQSSIIDTCGNLYGTLKGRLSSYPIPEIPFSALRAGETRTLLDVGCHWGRWCLAGARQGFSVIGIDPNVHAVLAAADVARQLGHHDILFAVADARFLPFAEGSLDDVHSYGVLQHISKEDSRAALNDFGRVVAPGGRVLVQLPNKVGILWLYHQIRTLGKLDEANPFRVRYYTPSELLETFTNAIGPSRLFVDGYFSLNVQRPDLPMLAPRHQWMVRASLALESVSRAVPPLAKLADSLYVESTRPRS